MPRTLIKSLYLGGMLKIKKKNPYKKLFGFAKKII